MRLYLEFVPEQSPVERARLSYAFAVFCAVYGHYACAAHERDTAEICASYALGHARQTIAMNPLYKARPLCQPAPPPIPYEEDGQHTVLVLDPANSRPDWLGEIFEWISLADEYSIPQNEPGAPVPFAASYHGRHGLDPYVPYAAVAMRMLQRKLCRVVPRLSERPVSPDPSVSHFVVNTHDIDLLPMGRGNSVKRLLKNAAISSLFYRMPRLSAKQIALAVKLLAGGRDATDQIWTIAGEEVRRSLSATYFFLCDNRHRRDGNYKVHDAEAVSVMKRLQQTGMEIAVHGSYLSLGDPPTLVSEFKAMAEQGISPKGNRQHWLRFRADRLISELEKVGVEYDSSLAWHETIGFRGGACFAFPPYNFKQECPAPFLEIPIAVMDVALMRGVPVADYCDHVARVLDASREYGWGGTAVLWHHTAFGECQMPEQLGGLFWALLNDAESYRESWISAAHFTELIGSRYSQLGLLSSTADNPDLEPVAN